MPLPAILLIIATLLPLATFVVLVFYGKRMGNPFAGYVGTAGILLAFACSMATMFLWLESGGTYLEAGSPTPVQLAEARTIPIEDTTEYVATLKSIRSTTIQPQIDGQITDIFVKSGDQVAEGARLMDRSPEVGVGRHVGDQAPVARVVLADEDYPFADIGMLD